MSDWAVTVIIVAFFGMVVCLGFSDSCGGKVTQQPCQCQCQPK